MKLVLYLGGPKAIVGNYCWCYMELSSGVIHSACSAAYERKAYIPSDTYKDADKDVSAYIRPAWFPKRPLVGVNDTAILPLEVNK